MELFGLCKGDHFPCIFESFELPDAVLLDLPHFFLEDCQAGIHNRLRITNRAKCNILKILHSPDKFSHLLRIEMRLYIFDHEVMRIDGKGVEYFRVVLFDPVLALSNKSDQFVLEDLQSLAIANQLHSLYQSCSYSAPLLSAIYQGSYGLPAGSRPSSRGRNPR